MTGIDLGNRQAGQAGMSGGRLDGGEGVSQRQTAVIAGAVGERETRVVNDIDV
jgi:hypothetical protein